MCLRRLHDRVSAQIGIRVLVQSLNQQHKSTLLGSTNDPWKLILLPSLIKIISPRPRIVNQPSTRLGTLPRQLSSPKTGPCLCLSRYMTKRYPPRGSQWIPMCSRKCLLIVYREHHKPNLGHHHRRAIRSRTCSDRKGQSQKSHSWMTPCSAAWLNIDLVAVHLRLEVLDQDTCQGLAPQA